MSTQFLSIQKSVPPRFQGPKSRPTQAELEALVKTRLEGAKKQLEADAGLEEPHKPFQRPRELPFTADQRKHTTILFGGLTWKHEKLVKGSFEGLGYKCEYIPAPDVKAFQLGKEYGNNGQCNPTYFTVGNVVQYLQKLEEQGVPRKEIIDHYIFLTAGACGPCRFGMYEAEYRLALRNSGYDGFRVQLFQQSGGLDQAEAEAGLEMNLDFFLGLLNALNLGDVVNELAHQIRPYEVHPGETDKVLEEAVDYLYEVMKTKEYFKVEGSLASVLGKFGDAWVGGAAYVGKFVDQLLGDHYIKSLHRVRDMFNAIEVDLTRTRPIVKITGEFWAQTTEGDGNFNMFTFLNREGAEVLVEPIATWVSYMTHQAKQEARDRHGVSDVLGQIPFWRLDKKLKAYSKTQKKIATLSLAEAILGREYDRLREALGGTVHELADQYELQRLGHPFYNSRSGGGEGHLEVAKNIYYSNKDLAHMVLSLKPFGCMPSTQSDGAQSAVTSLYKDMIFIPIETSGEGEINAHSRVQMALGEARVKAKEEMKRVLAEEGVELQQIQEYVQKHEELRRPLARPHEMKGVIGTGAKFVKTVAKRMREEGKLPARPTVVAAT